MSFETRESVIAEIKLCLENDGNLYRQSRHPYELNLLRKLMSKGKYVHSLAVQGWLNIVEQYLKIYARENAITNWYDILEPIERFALAEEIAHEFKESALLGEYDGLQLTKKVQFDSKIANQHA